MRGYKIIQKGEEWYFQLIPNNSKTQEIGCSKCFSSYSACKVGIQQFRKLVIENHIDSLESPSVTVTKCGREALLEYHIGGEMIFQSRKYSSSSPITRCEECVKSIHKHIDEYTLKQVI